MGGLPNQRLKKDLEEVGIDRINQLSTVGSYQGDRETGVEPESTPPTTSLPMSRLLQLQRTADHTGKTVRTGKAPFGTSGGRAPMKSREAQIERHRSKLLSD